MTTNAIPRGKKKLQYNKNDLRTSRRRSWPRVTAWIRASSTSFRSRATSATGASSRNERAIPVTSRSPSSYRTTPSASTATSSSSTQTTTASTATETTPTSIPLVTATTTPIITPLSAASSISTWTTTLTTIVTTRSATGTACSASTTTTSFSTATLPYYLFIRFTTLASWTRFVISNQVHQWNKTDTIQLSEYLHLANIKTQQFTNLEINVGEVLNTFATVNGSEIGSGST